MGKFRFLSEDLVKEAARKWQTGLRPLREVAEDYGLTPNQLNWFFKRLGVKNVKLSDKVRIYETDDCIEWPGGRDNRGYGTLKLKINGVEVSFKAHRYLYEKNIGPIPPGMLLCHKCDNPPCVNPRHLYVGTHLENMRDMAARKRARHARRSFHHLTSSQVEEIKKLSGVHCDQLASQFHVPRATILKIVRRS